MKKFILLILVLSSSFIRADILLQRDAHFIDSVSIGKISVAANGIWCISGDSNKIYYFSFFNQLSEVKEFNGITNKKFTCILAKGDTGVMVGTAGDYLLYYKNGILVKIGEANGIKNAYINSMFGNSTNTVVGTDSMAYESTDNINFSVYSDNWLYSESVKDKKTYVLRDKQDYEYMFCTRYDDPYYGNSRVNYFTSSTYYYFGINLSPNEIPYSIESQFSFYYHAYLASSTGFRFFPYIYREPDGEVITNSPSYRLCLFNFSCLVASKSGLFWYDHRDNPDNLISYVIKDTSAYDIANLNARIIWVATEKGLVRFSTNEKPVLSNQYSNWLGDTLTVCLSEKIKLLVKNTIPGDSIVWLHNDTVYSKNKSFIEIPAGGNYKAIIINKWYNIIDTTKSVFCKTNMPPDYTFYVYDTVRRVCKLMDERLEFISYGQARFKWKVNGEIVDTTSTFLPLKVPGIYSVLVYNCNNIEFETQKVRIEIVDQTKLDINYTSPLGICIGDSMHIVVNTDSYDDNYYWIDPGYNYHKSKDFYIKKSGQYYFYGNRNVAGCSNEKTLNFNYLPLLCPLISQEQSKLIASAVLFGNPVKPSSIKNCQWYYNDEKITGASDTVYIPSRAGSYKVEVTNNDNCTQFSTSFEFLPLGLKEKIGNNFSLYPNPTSGLVTFENISKNSKAIIEVVDSNGDILKHLMINSSEKLIQLDISSLPEGIYLINYFSEVKNFSSKVLLKK